ncbi:MAG: fumarate hydratase subunit alpha [Candidatus Saganbacteria bacterium]|uniref:Fumarate hydratase subunit alpha n=1 Tax=Candidatus Saganbacteria bacterium TaxID=2575572 RepID=A0A833P0B4_UNCSA|nr:MAG: fumarate hydratase subunit alpha [Candidatus Saganbacteria bacterium]
MDLLRGALKNEESKTGKEIITQIIGNAEIAQKEKLPLCQDTGIAVVFIEIGQEAIIVGGEIKEAVNEGVSQGYKNLRKSVVLNPIDRINTKDNTPAIIHEEIVDGYNIKIGILPKGGGAENMSAIKMFLPTAKKEDLIKFIVETVVSNGAKACPPLILGIGIGGTFDYAAYLAKKALTRKIGAKNKDTVELEKEILSQVNKTGLGPMGLGGRVTALAVHIETHPCHITSLPVAINFECHAHRYQEIIL